MESTEDFSLDLETTVPTDLSISPDEASEYAANEERKKRISKQLYVYFNIYLYVEQIVFCYGHKVSYCLLYVNHVTNRILLIHGIYNHIFIP